MKIIVTYNLQGDKCEFYSTSTPRIGERIVTFGGTKLVDMVTHDLIHNTTHIRATADVFGYERPI